MKKRLTYLAQLFTPGDAIAVAVIILGLLMALFINEMALRLIGVCLSILGAVALFMLISQRAADIVSLKERPVSQPTQFRTTVKQETDSKRMIFDDFATSFGADDEAGYESKFSSKLEEDVAREQRDTIAAKKYSEAKAKPAQQKKSEPTKSQKEKFSPAPAANDEFSSMRIVGRKKDEQKAEIPAKVENFDGLQEEILEDYYSAELQTETISRPEPAKENFEKIDEGFRIVAKKKEEKTAQVQNKNTVAEKISSQEKTSEQFEEKISSEETSSSNPAPEGAPAEKEKFPSEEKSHKKTPISHSIAEIFEEDSIAPQEPRKEFDYLLGRVLMVIRSVASARTAAFFWVNHDKRELVMESSISDAGEPFTSSRRKYPLSNDVISQIALNGRPEILTEIRPAAELDLIPYYSANAGTLSFVGVPVYYNQSVVGVLCADSTEIDAYDSITVGFLGHFTKLISGLIQSYTGKYDLFQSARTLETINDFRSNLNASQRNVDDIARAVIEAAGRGVDYFSIGVITYEEQNNSWHIADVHTKDNSVNLRGVSVKLENSLVGKTILTGKTSLIAPLREGFIRVHPHEPRFDGGFFAAVPLKSVSHNYGALFIETSSPLTTQDIDLLETLGEHSGTMIEQLRFHSMLQTTALVDASSGALNNSAFFQRVREELLRSADFNLPLSLCFIHIDRYSAMDQLSAESEENLFHHVLSFTQKFARPYDLVGRLDALTIGVLLSGMKIQQAQMWTERLRKEVASSVVNIEGKRITVTISAGLAEASSGQDSFESLVENTNKVLEMSLKQTNTVTSFT